MGHNRAGFTLIELVVVILIGSILTIMAFSSFASAMGGYSVRGARDTFAVMHARARTHAIEAGSTIHLFVSASGDSVVVRNGATVVDMVDYDSELNVDVVMSTDSMRLCMNSRGYADDGCNSFSNTYTIRFVQNADTASLIVLPLGQLVY